MSLEQHRNLVGSCVGGSKVISFYDGNRNWLDSVGVGIDSALVWQIELILS